MQTKRLRARVLQVARTCTAVVCTALLGLEGPFLQSQSQPQNQPQQAPAQSQAQQPAQTQKAEGQGKQEPAAKIPPDQLDSLVAPIALYPDPLLAQTLAA